MKRVIVLFLPFIISVINSCQKGCAPNKDSFFDISRIDAVKWVTPLHTLDTIDAKDDVSFGLVFIMEKTAKIEPFNIMNTAYAKDCDPPLAIFNERSDSLIIICTSDFNAKYKKGDKLNDLFTAVSPFTANDTLNMSLGSFIGRIAPELNGIDDSKYFRLYKIKESPTFATSGFKFVRKQNNQIVWESQEIVIVK